ncbi:MAG: MFS transporter [Magnetococcales bacterium]|nr:MFS transporter [Magnetococcales bacterium]
MSDVQYKQGQKNIVLLAICQGLFSSDKSIMILLSGLVGVVLASDKSLATLPVTATWLGGLLMTVPASFIMKRIGRKLGFQLGALLTILGSLLACYAIWIGYFPLLLVGTFISGANGGFAQFFRFAAVDCVAEELKPKAISLVLTGGVLAAFIGPKLAYWTMDLFSVAFVGAYLTQAIMAMVSIILLIFTDIPKPSTEEIHGPTRPFPEIIRQPIFMIALLAGVMGYGLMSLIMTATPLAMQGCGFAVSDAAFVIQWHLLAMFVPSFFTGSLIKRYGTVPIIQSGFVFFVVCSLLALDGLDLHHFSVALILLGLGWNFAFVGGSTLLLKTYWPAEKAQVQALNDFSLLGTVVLTSAISGGLLQNLGWDSLHWLALPLSVLSLVFIFFLDKKGTAVAQSS